MSSNNSTSTGSPPPTSPGLTTAAIIQAVYLIIVIIVSVIANSIVISAIFKKRLLRHVINYFILNLAIADLLNACLKMSTTVIGTFDRSWYGTSHVVCYFTTPFGVLFGAASVLNLTAVAINRYLVISAPLDYDRIMPATQAKVILMGVWLGSICLAIPPITWRQEQTICRSGAVDKNFYISELGYFCSLWIFVIILPLFIMTATYALIFRIARKQLHRIEELDVDNRHTDDAKKRRRKREIKTAVVLAVIGGAFILCWFPFFIIQTLYKFGNQKINPDYFKVFLCWMYSNSAINPILLIFFNQEVRMAVRRMLCKNQVSPEMTDFTLTQ